MFFQMKGSTVTLSQKLVHQHIKAQAVPAEAQCHQTLVNFQQTHQLQQEWELLTIPEFSSGVRTCLLNGKSN